ncbi:MAG: flagellar biosynthetic protein FliQ [Vampirovibrionales bacterium]|nr:flagellar biosynthetic protein FliQ [Vampirovibrionales bacterium]
MELMMDHVGKGMFLVLMLSMPAVFIAAGVGLVIGILQAVTQVQEQTISAAPKIILVFLLLIFGGGLMMSVLENFVRESTIIAFQEIPNEGKFLMPAMRTEERLAKIRKFFGNETQKGFKKSLNSNAKSMPDVGSSPGVRVTGQNKLGNQITEKAYLRNGNGGG